MWYLPNRSVAEERQEHDTTSYDYRQAYGEAQGRSLSTSEERRKKAGINPSCPAAGYEAVYATLAGVRAENASATAAARIQNSCPIDRISAAVRPVAV